MQKVLFFGIVFCFAVDASFADLIRVPYDYGNIQDAIGASVDGDEIVVADGTYSGRGNRNIDLHGKAIWLHSENGPAYCVIDCELLGRAFDFHSKEKPSTVIDGFSIINGHSIPNEHFQNSGSGGGIYLYRSSPTIRNCIISNCSAVRYSDTDGSGGAIMVYESTLILENCSLTNNTTCGRACGGNNYYGDAIATSMNSSVMIKDSLIQNDENIGNGNELLRVFPYEKRKKVTIQNTIIDNSDKPAVSIGQCDVNIRNCDISGSIGLSLSDCSVAVQHSKFESCSLKAIQSEGIKLSLLDCSFISNGHSEYLGPACVIHSGSILEAKDCYFFDNVSDFGSAIVADAVNLTSCEFISNRADRTWRSSSTVVTSLLFDSFIHNCLFAGNQSNGYGGAVYAFSNSSGTNLFISSSTFVDNVASYASVIYFEDGSSELNIIDSIIWDNRLLNGEEDGDPIFGEYIMSYSCLQSCDGWCDNEYMFNIDKDPLFTVGPNGNYYLSRKRSGQDASSPCVDAGSSLSENFDFNGMTTQTNQRNDEGQVDIGYHYKRVR